MKKTTRSLLISVLSLVLCLSMLVGSTFAWFTDEAHSGVNQILAGNLDVELDYWTGSDWADAKDQSVFPTDVLWEPGHTEVVYLRIRNAGSLALKYRLGVTVNNETVATNVLGDAFTLSSLVEFGAVNAKPTFASREDARKAVQTSKPLVEGHTETGELTAGGEAFVALVVFMPESVGNEANYRGTAPSIDLGISLLATQMNSEMDSFGKDYDANAAADFFPGFQGGSAGATVSTDDQGATAAPVSMAGGDVSAVVPVGVKLADNASGLKLSASIKASSEANIQLGENEKLQPVDVHMEGVAEGNTVPMLITLKHYMGTGINTGALKLYHVENGVSVAMTQVDGTPVNHNEFSYDPLTGDVTLAMASFSEVAVVADTTNTWDGSSQEFAQDADGNYLIANAGQLAYFRDVVDGKTVVEGLDPTFTGKTVKLTNNITLSKVNFDPIGWGYVETSYNRGGADGMVFMGTFDGNGNVILDLYQSGWDLESKTGTDYTYTNCGFGLFAAAADATFKNLTIYGADIRVECVEVGILVGLSQGSCTYENIIIANSKVANYQRPTGGLIGEISPLKDATTNEWYGNTEIYKVEIASDVVVGSLWGDFDAPCGGVIGARWDDSNTTTVVMENVTVGCRMDVYSDVTSAYQWYAYRRAGMLIGNTEQTAENNQHLAAARFLTCKKDSEGNPTVKVYYGDWANYTYYQFTNQENSWCNNYPWVRAEVGENCSAFSNPRYGQPIITGGIQITSQKLAEEHKTADAVKITFDQLYGGGQGVYGQSDHDGVEVDNYLYSITFINDYQVLDIKYIIENKEVVISEVSADAQHLVELWAAENIKGSWEFGGWMNAGSTKLTKIDKDNTKNIVLYPYFNNPYTARFVDQSGNVIAYCFFHKEDTTKLDATMQAATAALPDLGEDLEFDYWQIQITDNEGKVTNTDTYAASKFAGYEKDITIYPVYLYKGDVNLIPVDSDSDGIINYYQVGGYSNPAGQAMVEIPASVNGIPVTEINEDAFSSYGGVHSIVVPNGITIHKNAFTDGSRLGSGEEITIYFEGTKAQWDALNKETGWDYGIGNNSRIFFLKDGKVDTTQGYLQVGSRKWNEKSDFTSVKDQYTGYCDCEEDTNGDTAHTYVRVNADGTETIMLHNANGTPVNEQNVEIYWGVIKAGLFGSSIGEEKGLRDNDTEDTYKRYRPDKAYWEGVTIN